MSDTSAAVWTDSTAGSQRAARVDFGAVQTLWWREIVRFVRQRSRLVGAFAQPLVFWLLLGGGLNASFRDPSVPGSTYMSYFYPGVIALVLLFTAIFATIAVVEDRQAGFLQGVLLAPVSRSTIVLGQAWGCTTLGVVQGMHYLAFAPLVGIRLTPAIVGAMFVVQTLVAFGLTNLGLIIAWRMESTQGFHAIMNLALMPMWLLSGAFFPPPELRDGLPGSQVVLHWIMRLNPLSYCVAGVRHLLFGRDSVTGFWAPSLSTCWVVTILFSTAMFVGAWYVAGKRTAGDLL
jgi:ABC-2 type transport system permease protein